MRKCRHKQLTTRSLLLWRRWTKLCAMAEVTTYLPHTCCCKYENDLKKVFAKSRRMYWHLYQLAVRSPHLVSTTVTFMATTIPTTKPKNCCHQKQTKQNWTGRLWICYFGASSVSVQIHQQGILLFVKIQRKSRRYFLITHSSRHTIWSFVIFYAAIQYSNSSKGERDNKQQCQPWWNLLCCLPNTKI